MVPSRSEVTASAPASCTEVTPGQAQEVPAKASLCHQWNHRGDRGKPIRGDPGEPQGAQGSSSRSWGSECTQPREDLGKRVLENILQHGHEHQGHHLQDGPRMSLRSPGSWFRGATVLEPCQQVPNRVPPGAQVSHQTAKSFSALGINETQPPLSISQEPASNDLG